MSKTTEIDFGNILDGVAANLAMLGYPSIGIRNFETALWYVSVELRFVANAMILAGVRTRPVPGDIDHLSIALGEAFARGTIDWDRARIYFKMDGDLAAKVIERLPGDPLVYEHITTKMLRFKNLMS